MEKIGTKIWKKTQANRVLKKWNVNFLFNIKMNGKTLKFGYVEVSKREFHGSKQPIALNLVNVSQILISDKFKHSVTGFKYFIGCEDDNIIRPLCIILPQSRYIKHFDNGGKNMPFMIEDDNTLVKYNEIWNKHLRH